MKRATTAEQKIRMQEARLAQKQVLPDSILNCTLERYARMNKTRQEEQREQLLGAILQQSYQSGDQWIFSGVVRTLALQMGVSRDFARRAVAHFVACGILTPTGYSDGKGKPKEYIVNITP
ncbi:hypothetical protein MQE22_08630 [Acidithiobacillus sp. YTS05]|nr:hypothetical protein MQE22_08630 [Acidithiobacillus sp. YTS05]